MFFSRLKTKLSLIDDYIYIWRVKCYYSHCDYFCDEKLKEMFCGIVHYCEKIEKQYNKIFLRLKMLDFSFELLNKQLEQTKFVAFAKKPTTELVEVQKYQQNLQILKKIQQNLPKILKKLAFNDYEIGFIVQNA